MMKVKAFFSKYKVLTESFLSLYVLNGLDLILPLISLPYLLRVVGPAKYGIYAFVYVIIQYVLMFTNYGFNFSATKQIASVRDNPEKVNQVFHSVIYSRILIALVCIILLYGIAPFLIHDKATVLMLFLGLGMILGDLFVPVWLFQGLEKMRFLTLVNLFSKSLFTVLIFVVIRTADDFNKIILLNSLGSLLAGFASLYIVYKVLGIQLYKPQKVEIVEQFKDGLAVFGSTLSMNFYRNSNVFILGLFVSDAAVGVYAAAEKVVKAIQSIVSPIAQALFPHLSNKFSEMNKRDSISLLTKISRNLALLLFLLTVVTYFGTPLIVSLFGGKEFVDAIPLIHILSLIILFGGINYMLGIVGLINLNRQKDFLLFVLISGLVSVGFLLMTVHHLGNVAAVYSMVLSEVILFALCVYRILNIYKSVD